MTGSVLKDNKSLNEYFFGKDWNELLTFERFTHFQKRLQTEVMRKEVGIWAASYQEQLLF